jgi:antitoxin ParD1/3/4
MGVSLSKELQLFVETQVNSGLYLSPSEVIGEGLRLLQHVTTLPVQETLDWYDEQIELGLQQAEQGKTVSGEASYQRMKALFQSLESSAE